MVPLQHGKVRRPDQNWLSWTVVPCRTLTIEANRRGSSFKNVVISMMKAKRKPSRPSIIPCTILFIGICNRRVIKRRMNSIKAHGTSAWTSNGSRERFFASWTSLVEWSLKFRNSSICSLNERLRPSSFSKSFAFYSGALMNIGKKLVDLCCPNDDLTCTTLISNWSEETWSISNLKADRRNTSIDRWDLSLLSFSFSFLGTTVYWRYLCWSSLKSL